MSFVFDGFVVDPDGYRLLRNGQEVVLERRTFDLLLYLVKQPGRVVPKQELLERVWGARTLSEGALSNAVAKLRRALEQSPESKRPIETVHGRGYRFTAELEQAGAAVRSTSSDPFVGRQTVMQALLLRLDRGHRGSESLVVLSGEAGIGKTRMTRELADRARERGVSVWVGAAYEGGGAPPYWPWIQILRAARSELSESVWQACVPKGARAIAELVPELGLSSPSPASIEPQAARFQLFDEVSRFLKAVCAGRSLLVIIDDLHWADFATTELLGFSARVLEDQPAMLLATLRTGELPPHHDEHSPMQQLGRVATYVPLPGLTPAEISELAAAITGRDALDETRAHALHSRTHGNALFVRQTLDLVVQRGDWSGVDELMSGAELPPAIRHVIRRRLAGLSEATRRLLQAAAVIGSTFEVAILAAVTELTLERVLDDLEPALQIGVIERSAERPSELAFSHVLAKDSLYEELGSRKRGELHARIARVLSQRHGQARSRRLGEIAEHYLEAVPFDIERAADACRKAAAAAQEASGFEAAAHLLSRAIVKIDAEGGDAVTRCRLLLELGEDQFYAGRIDGAWNALRDAADTIQPSGPIELLAEIAPRLADCLELGVGEDRVARAVIEQCLAGLPQDACALRASTLAQRAELALELPVEQRFAILDQAAELAERSGAPEAILEVAHSRAILRDPTRLRENAEAADRFLSLTEQYPEAAAGMRYRSLRRFGAHLTRYLCALTACDIEAADVALEQCRQIADASHVTAARFGSDLMDAGRALADGRLVALEHILSNRSPRGEVEAAAWSSYVLALFSARGNTDALSGLNLEGNRLAHDATFRHAPYVAIGSAELYALTGRSDRARAVLAQIPASLRARMPAQYGDFGALCSLVEICRVQNDRARAEQLYDRLSPHAAQNAVYPTFEYRGSIAHFLGILARMLGRPAKAREHLQHAIEVNRKLGVPIRLALTERELRDVEAMR